MNIVRADRRSRIVVGCAFLALVALGAGSILVLENWLSEVRQLAPADARRALRSAFAWISGGAFVFGLLVGLYLWRLGVRIQRAGQFPLPGARVIRDTEIVRGDEARRRASLMKGLGVLLVVCAAVILATSWFLYSSVLADRGAPMVGLFATKQTRGDAP